MLIDCAADRACAKLADIPAADISDYLAQPSCFMWVAMRDASKGIGNSKALGNDQDAP